jgi:hypothetical protein
VRVNSDKQTLILAGEIVPWTGIAKSVNESAASATTSRTHRLTIVATRAEPMLLVQGEYAQHSGALVAKTPYASTNRGSSFSAANEYARTQELPGFGNRTPIIDTYA